MPAPWRPYRSFLNKNIVNTRKKNSNIEETLSTLRNEDVYCQSNEKSEWNDKYWSQNYKQLSISDIVCKATLGKYKKRWRKIREETKEANSF